MPCEVQTAVANIADGIITSIDVTNEGSGYIVNPTITVSDPTTRRKFKRKIKCISIIII
jgi:hypothetical protein